MFRIINIVQTKIVYIIHNRALKNKKYSIFYKKQKTARQQSIGK